MNRISRRKFIRQSTIAGAGTILASNAVFAAPELLLKNRVSKNTEGGELLFYSPNWVYALILFVAFALQQWADRRWLQVFLILFLALLINTNLRLIYRILDVSLPYFGK